ncbi:putative DNA-binding domain-containing protein [Aliikangiella coralliicola]|uniref:DUF2063 domain-containing protein n=1 Tax=Aliikangiella coralliicola TaxID=2592383 RepID=A0A545U751_9GAMM|nr:putative DNA-binding domain-containing protein [Aliikangiella coralliicola]TQV85287.1 DUF2063 domain-containing protein [Aliikangiella coralliicola]
MSIATLQAFSARSETIQQENLKRHIEHKGTPGLVGTFGVEAMMIRYPVIFELLGDKKFHEVAESYFNSRASVFTDIDEVGDDFAAFLSDHHGLGIYPYLSRIAEVEWLTQNLEMPEEIQSSWWEHLKNLFKSETNFKVKLSKNVRLVRSYHGEIEIWLSHQTIKNQFTKNRAELLVNLTSNYWLFQKTAEGVSVTPLTEEVFKLCRDISRDCSIKKLSDTYSYHTIKNTLASLVHGNLCHIV